MLARMSHDAARKLSARALYIGALGVVFGDIGTSPLYTLQTAFNPEDKHVVTPSIDHVYGVISLIFWSIMLVVTVTYVLIVLRADNKGEGGGIALITLVRDAATRGSFRTKSVLAMLGIFGVALFFGDSVITPAISVLSAVEGLKVVEPSLEHLIVPITAAIIVALFAIQRFGTAVVGRAFGPIMVLWFSSLAVLGVHGITKHPAILRALSPSYALDFLFSEFHIAFFALSAVVLSITGAEALYADLAHFGRIPIIRAWLSLVLPACVLNYLGQGALILDDPKGTIASPFFHLVPDWGVLPMVILATFATVIASQAVITGAFSLAHQAAQKGYLPRLRVKYTSAESSGQIYVPGINWLILVGVLILVFTFRSSVDLAFAYGMAVTGTISITTALILYVARRRWGAPRWAVLGGGAVLLAVDLLFLAANITKIPSGAWLTLSIAVVVFTIFTTWNRGRDIVTRQREAYEGSLRDFIDDIHTLETPIARAPGTAIFLNRNAVTTPLAMRACIEHLHVLHEHVVILSIEAADVAHVPLDERLSIDDLGYTDDGISHVAARFGYMDASDVPEVLEQIAAADLEAPVELDDLTYFLSTIELRRGDMPGIARWRRVLFLLTARVTADPVEYFGLPRDRTIIMGAHVDIERVRTPRPELEPVPDLVDVPHVTPEPVDDAGSDDAPEGALD
ncbi:MAG: potassium transporter Kup [Thermoleophilia bacterium]|nr:potassium transporter Kup [Thermoleophilia bacterium]